MWVSMWMWVGVDVIVCVDDLLIVLSLYMDSTRRAAPGCRSGGGVSGCVCVDYPSGNIVPV